MIEIIYDETNEGGTDVPAGRCGYELPKNIRQVGNAPGNYKIYVEDYVMTYLRKIASPGNMNCRGAILLGKVYDEGQGKVIFVSGAVDAQNLEFDISVIHFGDGVWSNIYSEINKYFDDLAIVGWFLSRMGFSALINDQMKKLHRENFQGEDKLLFLMDSLECDEAFYYYQHGDWMREKGYYIYYVRNEKMQNYIISRKNSSLDAAQNNLLLKDKTVVENFRQKDKTGNVGVRKNRIGEAAACFAVVCALAAGSLWYISPETVNRIGDKISNSEGHSEVQVFVDSGRMSDSIGGDAGSYAVNHAEKNDVSTDSVMSDDVLKEGKDLTDAAEDGTAGDVLTESETESDETYDQTQSDMTDYGDNVYVVQTGDTLVSIAIKMYGDVEKVEDIASANGLGIDDPIYEGQKLVIPNVD